jgi:hypothetical protein
LTLATGQPEGLELVVARGSPISMSHFAAGQNASAAR